MTKNIADNFESFRSLSWNNRDREWNLNDDDIRFAKSFSCENCRFDSKDEIMNSEIFVFKRSNIDVSKRINKKLEKKQSVETQNNSTFKKIRRDIFDQQNYQSNKIDSNIANTNTLKNIDQNVNLNFIYSQSYTQSIITRENNLNNMNTTNTTTQKSISLTSSIAIATTFTSNSIKNTKTIRLKNTEKNESLKSRYLKNILLFDWNEYCNSADIIISLTQLFDIIFRARMSMIDVMKMKNSNRKNKSKNQQIHFENKEINLIKASSISNYFIENVLNEINIVKNYEIKKMSTSLIVLETFTEHYSRNDIIRQMTKIMNKVNTLNWSKILTDKLNISLAILLRKLKLLSLTSQSTHSHSHFILTSHVSFKNFYTETQMKFKKSLQARYDIKKILMNSKNILNLISKRIAFKINCLFRENKSMTIIIVNNVRVQLLSYIIIEIIMTNVTQIVQFFIMLEKTSYSIILKRF